MQETKRRKRVLHMQIIFFVVFGLLFTRVFYLQVILAEELRNKASSQWVHARSLTPVRGSIIDRNGEILAQSATADTVMLRPKQIQASSLNTKEDPQRAAHLIAEKLSVILEMAQEKIYGIAVDTSKSEVWLKRQVGKEQAELVRRAIADFKLPGIAFATDTKRYYPKNDFLTQVLGFTSVDGDGLEGLERYYDRYLAGEAGKTLAVSDRLGNPVAFSEEDVTPAVDGYTLELTIDYTIQNLLEEQASEAYETYQAKGVWAVAMDPNTGEILGMVNQPGYDLNNPPRDNNEKLVSESRNRVISDIYEPGSVFKIFTAAAALELGKATQHSTFQCTGGRMVNGEWIKCWSNNHSGTFTLGGALSRSCNPCFMDLALSMGKEPFYEMLGKFGLGTPTGIDVSGEAAGMMREISQIRSNDLARIGFGQSISATPVQMLNGICGILNGGTLYTPHLVKRVLRSDRTVVEAYTPETKGQVVSESTSALMRNLLEEAGGPASVAGYRVGGKSGTAQKYDEVTGQVMQGEHISSYMAFAPADDPQIAVLFIVDGPETEGEDFGSVISGPRVKKFMERALPYLNVPSQSSGIAKGGTMATVPDLLGKSKEEATGKASAVGLNITFSGEGQVIDQVPAAGTIVRKGETVVAYLRSEELPVVEKAVVPDVMGKNREVAEKTMEEAGLQCYVRGSGIVYWQSLKPGTEVEKGTTVQVELNQ